MIILKRNDEEAVKMKRVKNKKNDVTVIAGCGRLGANLANTLSDEGESVIVIDKDRDSFRKLSPSFSGFFLVGDAAEMMLRNEADLNRAHSVIAVTNNDNSNIFIAQVAKEVYQVDKVIARLYDPERECVYQEFGIDTICPAVLSAHEVEKIMGTGPEVPES